MRKLPIIARILRTRAAGHFLQEDKGVEVAHAVTAFIRSTPTA